MLVPLTGALSKNGTANQLARLNALRKKLLREAAKAPKLPTPPPPRRIGEISGAINEVLTNACEPLHAAEIHHAVERLLGRSVNYRSVKGCLSEGAAHRPPRFERISYGRYRLAANAGLASANRRRDRGRQT